MLKLSNLHALDMRRSHVTNKPSATPERNRPPEISNTEYGCIGVAGAGILWRNTFNFRRRLTFVLIWTFFYDAIHIF